MERSTPPTGAGDERFLRDFGQRIRAERARRGMSRRLLADHAGISERYVTQLESGKGNASLLILRQIAAALGLPLARLVEPDSDPELALLNQFLSRLGRPQLHEAQSILAARFASDATLARGRRIALIGLRGAGKTTLGSRLARDLELPFFELDREIERLSGAPLASILEMYGQVAYRRYEQQALQEILTTSPRFVLATGGSIVSETATYELLLRHCFTVWVRAAPEEHMARVIAQGDRRPMAGSAEAMEDLRRILDERTPLYSRADSALDTSGKTAARSLQELKRRLPHIPAER